jgi:hypothetical protein
LYFTDQKSSVIRTARFRIREDEEHLRMAKEFGEHICTVIILPVKCRPVALRRSVHRIETGYMSILARTRVCTAGLRRCKEIQQFYRFQFHPSGFLPTTAKEA